MTTAVPRLRRALKKGSPGRSVEQELWDAGMSHVVGLDEVGRGAWAGPLSVGAVMIPRERRIYKVRDSKMLTESEREALFERVSGWAEAWSVGHASHEECDELGMADAQRLAANRAISGLGFEPDKVLLDGNWDFVERGTTTTIVKGDASCLSIAAASIVAKVTRDRIMRQQATDYPWYDFEENKGYPSPLHRRSLAALGPSAIHRRSWVFMDHLPWNGLRRHERPDPQGTLFD